MDYVNLGKTGVKVSRICLGAMTYGSKNGENGSSKKRRRFLSLRKRSTPESTSSIQPMFTPMASARRSLAAPSKPSSLTGKTW